MANVPGAPSQYNPRALLHDNPNTVTVNSVNSNSGTVHSGICIDSGATEHVVGHAQCSNASNVTTLEESISCDTVGGEVEIDSRGDVEVEGIAIDQGLMAPWSTMTLLSLTQLLREGWEFFAKGMKGYLYKGEKVVEFSNSGGLLKPIKEDPNFLLASACSLLSV